VATGVILGGMSSEDAALIRKALETSRTIALVGASPDPARDSNDVMAFLLRRGYRVIPVNPLHAGESIHGQRVRASLDEVDEPVDMVDVFRRSDALGPVVEQAIAHGARYLWLQIGAVNEEAAARARAAGLGVVMDRCPKVEMPRLGIQGPRPDASG
jgi:predicted CoA-binding protein